MGKRKSSSKPPPKKQKQVLPTNFRCLFCNSETSITVRIDKRTSTGSLSCKVCGQSYSTSTHALSAPVDVYADWVDACDAVAKAGGTASGRVVGASNGRPETIQEDRYEEDDFIINDEGDEEAGYRPE